MKTATIIIGAVLLGGGYLYMKHEQAAAQGPTLEDQANKALASESNPYTLKALAVKVRAAGFGTLADMLDAKASAILAFQTPQQTKLAEGPTSDLHPAATVALAGAGVSTGSSSLSLHQALLQGGIHAPREIDGGFGPQPDPNLSPQNL